MKELIENMIGYAEKTKDFVIIDFVDTLLYIFDDVINTPSEWADIGMSWQQKQQNLTINHGRTSSLDYKISILFKY